MSLPGYTKAIEEPEKREYLRHAVTTQASPLLTICEQLRFIYDDVAQLPDGELKSSLTEKLIDAMGMGKKMNARLVFYKKKEGKYSGAGGAHLIKLNHTKRRKRLRSEREAVNL